VPTEGFLTFDLVAILRFNEGRAYKQQDHVRVLKAMVNVVSPVRTRRNHAIVPFEDASVPLFYNQLTPNIIHEFFVFVRVREEDLNWAIHTPLPSHQSWSRRPLANRLFRIIAGVASAI
jgi:hypothetical protein